MLIHGLMDENVHFRHTVHLIEKLTEQNKEYELVVFPRGRHSVRSEDRGYLENRISLFMDENLK